MKREHANGSWIRRAVLVVAAAIVICVWLVSRWDGVTKHNPPIFIIVFDELSTEVLLNANKEIDSRYFPNFAGLVESSYWYRNTTSVATETQFGVPAIMTGKYPPLEQLRMTYGNYPQNICTLLWRAGYNINADEWASTLCQRWAGAKVSYEPELLARLLVGMEKMTINDQQDRGERFINWVDGLKTKTNSFNLIHLSLPHAPYEYKPEGTKYNENGIIDWRSSDIESVWENEYLAATGYRQYIWQVQYVDELLGLFLNRLKELGVYDEALVMVTSDHGVTYRLGANRRWPVMNNSGGFVDPAAVTDLIKVPLFIKLPQQVRGQILDRRAMNMDVLPTLLDYLGIPPTYKTDGRSLLMEAKEEDAIYILEGRTHTERNVLKRQEHKLDINDDEYDVTEIKSKLDAERQWAVRTVWDNMIGQDIDSVDLAETDAKVTVDYFDSDMVSGVVSERGENRGSERQLALGVVVNNKIAAVIETYGKEEKRKFLGLLFGVKSSAGGQVVPLGWSNE